MDQPRRDPTEHPGRSRRLAFSWLFGLLILAAVVLVASRFTELKRFTEIARAAQPTWLLVAFVLQGLTYFCAAAVWYVALRRAGHRQNYWSIVPLGLAKLFTDQALPTGGIGGTLLVVSGLKRRGIPSGIGMAALLISLVSFYTAYLAAVLTSLAILYSARVLDARLIVAAGAFVIVAFGVPAAALGLRHWSQRKSEEGLSPFAERWLRRVPGLSALLSGMAEAPGELLRDPPALLVAIALQVAIFALDIGTLWVMLHALGAHGSPAVAIAAFSIASLAATVGPMPLGLGTFEAVCVTMLHVQGLSVEVALTATLLLRGFTFWLPMAPGLLLARRELKHPKHQEGDADS
jgi:uncharacterized protein (TIRG00374 family)